MAEKGKNFSIRRFVSVMTLCTFVITALSGIIMLVSHGPSDGSHGFLVNWKGLHETGCIFFVIFGIWHIVLNFKVMCRYFTGSDNGKLVFRMDWCIPVVLAILFFGMICFLPNTKHGYQDYNSVEHSRGFKAHHR